MSLLPVYSLYPITIERAEGSWLWDDQGQRYLDMYGGHAVISIGHSHPHYVARLTEQLHRIGFYSNSVRIPQQEALAERLERLTGKRGYQLFMCNSGAEANENAFKLASFHTRREKIVSFTGAFHGRTSLAVAATDNPAIVAPVNETEHTVMLPFNDVAALENYFADEGDEVAAVIVEGIQGVGGIRVASKAFLRAIRRLCDTYGAVYIADSVQCGYGRTGRFFAHDWAEVDADIYSMAKGMGNGFPVAGIWVAPHFKGRTGMLGTTFGGNHLACVAALAVLEVMEQENLLQNAAQRGQQLMQALEKVEGLQNLRGRGLMIGFDLDESLKDLRRQLLLEGHVFTGEAKPHVVRLLPALNVTDDILAHFVGALTEQVESLRAVGVERNF